MIKRLTGALAAALMCSTPALATATSTDIILQIEGPRGIKINNSPGMATSFGPMLFSIRRCSFRGHKGRFICFNRREGVVRSGDALIGALFGVRAPARPADVVYTLDCWSAYHRRRGPEDQVDLWYLTRANTVPGVVYSNYCSKYEQLPQHPFL